MQVEFLSVQEKVISILMSIISEWGDEIEDDIEAKSLLVEEIGFASIDFVQLAVAIEKEYDRKLGFQNLLMKDGAYVEDLSIQEVSNFVYKQINGLDDVQSDHEAGKTISKLSFIPDHEKVNESKLQQFKSIIKPLPVREGMLASKNPSAVFILSPPRSGSTLLRVMLAGSPQLFVPPELHLLSYNTMSQRKSGLDDEHSNHLLEGTIRALMQLRDWDAEYAREFVSGCEEKDLSCQQFYKLMQTTMGKRLLVDKTPSYAINLDILKRAETDFENAKYIHLLRHPCGTIRSYEESKLTRMMPLMSASDFNGRELAEMTWQSCHENILEFSEQIDSERILPVKYEDLVVNPEAEVHRICDFLQIEYHPEMINPYGDNQARMADGVEVASKMSGDLKFHLHSGIDSSAALRWQEFYSEDILGEITKNTARRCGYDLV